MSQRTPCLLLFFLLSVYSAIGQNVVNPGRPSFSENTFVVYEHELQSENGLLMQESKQSYTYAFSSLWRMGIRDRWEGRMFSGLEQSELRGEAEQPLKSAGLGAGIKYLAARESALLPSVAILLQTTYAERHFNQYSLAILASKQIGSLAVDANVNVNFVDDDYRLTYIVCAGYPVHTATVFLEGIYEHENPAAEFVLHGGVCKMLSPRWQIDFSLASSGPRLVNQMVQVGCSFLISLKKGSDEEN